jgi:hypothetical protein
MFRDEHGSIVVGPTICTTGACNHAGGVTWNVLSVMNWDMPFLDLILFSRKLSRSLGRIVAPPPSVMTTCSSSDQRHETSDAAPKRAIESESNKEVQAIFVLDIPPRFVGKSKIAVNLDPSVSKLRLTNEGVLQNVQEAETGDDESSFDTVRSIVVEPPENLLKTGVLIKTSVHTVPPALTRTVLFLISAET